MIELNRIYGGYNKSNPVVKDISFSFSNNEVTALVGPNGCGKSTLLKIISGIITPFEGSIKIDGVETSSISSKSIAKQISYLPQNRPVPDMNIETLVLHGRFPHLGYPRRYKKADFDIVTRSMRATGVLSERHTLLSQLSGGQRQKAYLALLLAQNAPVMLLDEPTPFLDMNYQLELMELICAQKDKSVLIVLHDLNLALSYADKIGVMQNGELVFFGTPNELYCSGCIEKVFSLKPLQIKIDGNDHYLFNRI